MTIQQYMALAISPAMWGIEKREDTQKNLAHISDCIDAAIWLAGIEMPVKLITIPEGAIQAFTDEMFDWAHSDVVEKLAATLPGPETEVLSKKAKEYQAYVVAQMKVKHPDIPGRFFNAAFLINPKGDIVLTSYKVQVFTHEHSTVPHDMWDRWLELYGDNLMDSLYPVADTDIGRVGLLVCQEGDYPEPARGLAVNGAEIIYRSSSPEPSAACGWWEVQNRARALDNTCYVVAPNVAQYYPTMNSTIGVDTFGGQSMVVDYHGQVISNHKYGGTPSYAGAILDIESLREYRETSLFGNWLKDLRMEQYKIIYDEPIFEKNLCMNRTPLKHTPTYDIYRASIKRLIDRGVWVQSSKTRK